MTTTILTRILDFIAPEVCLECNSEGIIWCDNCRLQYDPLPSRCFLCHSITKDHKVCIKCRKNTKLNSVYVYGEYKDINQQLIKAFKFGYKRHVGLPIAKSMANILPYYPPSEEVFLVPIPTIPSHIRQRGFDQTVILANELSKQTGLKVENILRRTTNIHQVGSNRSLRKLQIEGSFKYKLGGSGIPSHVILVDDVVTTGATLSEATKVLKENGVKKVDAVSFCYTT